MVSQQGPARRPTFTSRAEKQRLREIAQLRARRAARRSSEVAAGKRRMVVSGFFAALTVIVGLIAAVSAAVSWAWALLPFAALVGSLAVSRRAAIRFEEVSRAEQARLEELMGLVPMGEADAVDRRAETGAVEVEAEAPVEFSVPVEAASSEVVAEAVKTPVVESVDESLAREVKVDDVEASEVVDAAASDVEATDAAEAVEAAEAPVEAEIADEAEGSAKAEAPAKSEAPAAWVPAPIPAPMYAQRARVGGRLVHPDTDLRGIPKVAASVPMRPAAVSEGGAPLRSTEEVAAAQPVPFDLDAILESRRAL